MCIFDLSLPLEGNLASRATSPVPETLATTSNTKVRRICSHNLFVCEKPEAHCSLQATAAGRWPHVSSACPHDLFCELRVDWNFPASCRKAMLPSETLVLLTRARALSIEQKGPLRIIGPEGAGFNRQTRESAGCDSHGCDSRP